MVREGKTDIRVEEKLVGKKKGFNGSDRRGGTREGNKERIMMNGGRKKPKREKWGFSVVVLSFVLAEVARSSISLCCHTVLCACRGSSR